MQRSLSRPFALLLVSLCRQYISLRRCGSKFAEHTFTKLFEVFPETLLPFPIVAPPAVEAAVLLPLSSPFCPAGSRAFHFVFEQTLEFLSRVSGHLLYLDLRLSQFPCAFSAIFIESLPSRGNRGEQHVSRIRHEERQRRVPRMEGVDVLLSQQCLSELYSAWFRICRNTIRALP